MSRRQVIGLISDTHGLLRPEALDLLRGSVVGRLFADADQVSVDLMEVKTRSLIPSLVDQDRYAQSRDPIEMIVQG
jgi:hypothetical protein